MTWRAETTRVVTRPARARAAPSPGSTTPDRRPRGLPAFDSRRDCWRSVARTCNAQKRIARRVAGAWFLPSTGRCARRQEWHPPPFGRPLRLEGACRENARRGGSSHSTDARRGAQPVAGAMPGWRDRPALAHPRARPPRHRGSRRPRSFRPVAAPGLRCSRWSQTYHRAGVALVLLAHWASWRTLYCAVGPTIARENQCRMIATHGHASAVG
jgi:hypothetical protein